MSGEPDDPRLPDLASAPWLSAAGPQRIMALLATGGFEARVVGGAVRNALMGVPVKDIDFATTAPPDDVVRLATAGGLGVVPTGLAHGTVTLIADHQPFEVTTLRRDVETDGRHARVSFKADWSEDAARRDFTINALYCSADGTVHDPLGGYADLAARRVRFIGDAEARIREDYLRILRFFRFTAEYSSGDPDAEGLRACAALAPGLAGLSAERIRSELMRLLGAPRAAEIAQVMDGAGLIAPLLGQAVNVALLGRLADIEAALSRAPDPLLRLAALANAGPGVRLTALGERLRLSNADVERLHQLALPSSALDPASDERKARAFIYRFGVPAFRDGVLLAWARSDAPPSSSPSSSQWRGRFVLPNRWKTPVLPVRGADLIQRGLAEGPAIGRVLSAFEDWWIAEDFPQDELRLAHALSDIVKANRN
jgi:poly(A) polymerase